MTREEKIRVVFFETTSRLDEPIAKTDRRYIARATGIGHMWSVWDAQDGVWVENVENIPDEELRSEVRTAFLPN